MRIPPEQTARRPRPSPRLPRSESRATPGDRAPDSGPAPASRGDRGGRPRIAVLRALALGDLLCAVPALRALRAANPDAEISLIGLPWAREFVARYPEYLDRFVEFPGFPGIPERPIDAGALTSFLAEAQAHPFDLAIQLQGNGLHSNGFVQLLGARRAAGYYLPAAGCPDPESFAPYPGHGPEIRRHIALMEFLGFPAQGEQLEFPLRPSDEAEAVATRRRHGLRQGAYVCLHPGASIARRRWPAERFAAIGDCLAELGLRVVLTGTDSEARITATVAAAMRHAAVDLAGATSLGGLAAFVSGARLLVSNDTGVAHIAAALRIPSVVIYLSSERARWAALDERLHAAVGAGSTVGCRDHPDGDHRCLRDACMAPRPSHREDVTVEQVWAAVERQIALAPEAPDVA